MRADLKKAWDAVGGLSSPSKMPGYAYGLSAKKCKIGSILREIKGSTCEKCYAFKGFYGMPVVTEAHRRRLRSLARKKWVVSMSALISHYSKKEPYFRWHDSGDLQSLAHLLKICEVARSTPQVRHWLPTREVGIVREYQRTIGSFPSNLCVRVSAPMIDGSPGKAFENTSTVHTKTALGHECPARAKYNNTCGPCRACWDKGVKNVSYPAH